MLNGAVDRRVSGVMLNRRLVHISVRVRKAIHWRVGNLILGILRSIGCVEGRLLRWSLPVIRVLVGVCHGCCY